MAWKALDLAAGARFAGRAALAAAPLPAAWAAAALLQRRLGSLTDTLSSGGSSSTIGHAPAPALGTTDAGGYGGASAGGLRVQLVRDFIHDSLYHPTEGYFSKQQTDAGCGVVGSLPAPLDFHAMAGQVAYLQAVQEQYRALQASWLTPVEIFRPHYGRALAACLLARWRGLAAAAAAAGRAPPPLRVYEVGGGTGTLARDVLDWLRLEHPEAYSACRYTCIEISPVLAALQQRKVAAEGGHAGRFAVRRHDAAHAHAWAAADAVAEGAGPQPGSSGGAAGRAGSGGGSGGGGGRHEHCFIVLCEVLDNLSHDRVQRGPDGGWLQTLVARRTEGCAPLGQRRQHGASEQDGCFELLQPAADPLVLRCLGAWEAAHSSSGGSAGGGGGGGLASLGRLLGGAVARAAAWGLGQAEVRWLPTGCLQLLDTLRQVRPCHTLIAADFTALPEVAVAGVGAPLVATTAGGSTLDHGTYLVPRGTADIFFPTDFALLAELYRQAGAAGRAHQAGAAAAVTEHMCTADFMKMYCPDLSATTTRDGYNPLLQDYTNTAFLLGSTLGMEASCGGQGGG